MAKRQTTYESERRTTRSSGILDAPQELTIPKKQKTELEAKLREESTLNLQVAQNETIESDHFQKIRLSTRLPDHLVPHFRVQKQTVLRALKETSFTEFHSSSKTKVSEQLNELIHGTVNRHEGNSCLILGPRGSGKTKLVQDSLSSLKTMGQSPIIIRLSGDSQLNDRLAMREILRQVQEQEQPGFELPVETEEDQNPHEETLDIPQDSQDMDVDPNLPPASHLPQLIGSLPNLGRPVIIILDSFNKFTEHYRQALLYCLLDTVQSCRGELAVNHTDKSQTGTSAVTKNDKKIMNSQKESGLLVIGITCRIDCVTLLEKRVKSRFSHRILRSAASDNVQELLQFFKVILTTDPGIDHIFSEEWQALWSKCISDFLSDQEVQATFKEIYLFSKDIRSFIRILLSSVASLTPDSPWLRPGLFQQSVTVQRCRNQFPYLKDLAYPNLSLLIAAIHAFTAGQETFTFELLYDRCMSQVNKAAVNSERGEINMPYMSRNVLLAAFESLIDNCVFYPAIPHAAHISKEFMKYHCKASREDVKNVIDELGNTGLRRWLYRSH